MDTDIRDLVVDAESYQRALDAYPCKARHKEHKYGKWELYQHTVSGKQCVMNWCVRCGKRDVREIADTASLLGNWVRDGDGTERRAL